MLALVLALWLLKGEKAFAWGTTGHRVVAAIAQNHLSPKARLALENLIGRESLAMWANWPDFIKSDTTHTWDSTFKWHYVDLPGALPKDEFIKELKQLPGENPPQGAARHRASIPHPPGGGPSSTFARGSRGRCRRE